MTGYIVVFGWPVAAAMFFSRYHRAFAISLTLVGGYLLLPVLPRVDLPLLPTLDKDSIPAFAAVVLALAGVGTALKNRSGGKSRARLIPREKFLLLLLIILLLCGFGTAYLNGDTLRFGPRQLPGLTLYDGLSTALTVGVMIVPFLLGYAYLSRPEDHRTVLIVLVIFGVLYSMLALYEIRMSPQLNRTFYGFFPHSWVQHKRGGSWRPIVFLKHGLYVGIYLAMATLAALALLRQSNDEWRNKAKWMAVLIGCTLLFSSNLGAMLIVVILAPVLFFLSPKMQLLLAALIAALVLTYPMARGAGLVPTSVVISLVEKIDTERADSLQFRLDNEDVLLAKATQRPVFGWGGWTRSRVFDERGRHTTITDGYWVIIFGEGGWVRYLAEMGLLCFPIIILGLRHSQYDVGPYTTGLVIVLVANLVDLIPNAGISPVTWMIAGAIWGRLALGKIEESLNETERVPAAVSSYTRQTEKIDRKRPAPTPVRQLSAGPSEKISRPRRST